jgi:hypothetical protein
MSYSYIGKKLKELRRKLTTKAEKNKHCLKPSWEGEVKYPLSCLGSGPTKAHLRNGEG